MMAATAFFSPFRFSADANQALDYAIMLARGAWCAFNPPPCDSAIAPHRAGCKYDTPFDYFQSEEAQLNVSGLLSGNASPRLG